MISWPQLPTNKKYTEKYEKFIIARKNRNLPDDEYFETHHIVPRSLGGTDDNSNLIKLTAREHYIAHAILWKMKFSGNYHAKMAYAFCTFMYGFKHKKHKQSYKFSSRLYEAFKKDLSELQSELLSGKGNPFYGKNHSEETKNKIRKYRKGKKQEEIFSPESLKNIREARKNLVITEEQKQKQKESIKKYWENDKNKEKVSKRSSDSWKDPLYREKMNPYIEARRGVPRDPKIIEKGIISKRKKVEAGIPYYSEEGLKSIREAAKNRVLTEEYIQNLKDRAITIFKGRKQTPDQIRKRVEARKKTMDAKKAAGWVRKPNSKPVSQETIEKIKATKGTKKAAGWINPCKGVPRDPKIIAKMNKARLAKRKPKSV